MEIFEVYFSFVCFMFGGDLRKSLIFVFEVVDWLNFCISYDYYCSMLFIF